MQTAMTLTYEVGEALYINVTNRCSCACTFCIRKNDDGAYGSDSLWLAHEPDMAEMQAAIQERDVTKYTELVFCGYGEPTMRLDFICELAAWIREMYPDVCLRLNTNGLADIYVPEETGDGAAARIAAVFDKVSVSLNGGNPEVYERVTRPQGSPADAYDTMLHFAASCKAYGAQVLFTVVDVITPDEIEAAQAKADALDIPLRVRTYIQ